VATVCSVDQQPLESCTPSSTATESQPSKTWPPQVVVPAVLWLVVNFLLVGLFTVGASFLFGLLTALWAAIDCSKLQSRGSRTLGIAFKPVVVFAVVAFFLWGFGFIWYLIMRHRVKTAPIDLESEREKVAA
jgi:sterol desaturase/sphingolipid hydroxylase (fatty acid hydroxylase superfamily)